MAERSGHDHKAEEVARALNILNELGAHDHDETRAELVRQGISADVIHDLLPEEDVEDEKKETLSDAFRKRWPQVRKAVRKHRSLSVALIGLGVVSSYFYFQQLTAFLAVLLMFVLGSFSTYYKRKLGVPLGGFELVTFGTVITGALYGPWAGAAFGGLALTASSLLSADVSPTTTLGVAAMAAGGLVAGLLYAGNIAFLGMLVTLGILAVSQLPYLPLADMEMKTSIIFYLVTNLITNMLLFVTIGQIVVDALA